MTNFWSFDMNLRSQLEVLARVLASRADSSSEKSRYFSVKVAKIYSALPICITPSHFAA